MVDQTGPVFCLSKAPIVVANAVIGTLESRTILLLFVARQIGNRLQVVDYRMRFFLAAFETEPIWTHC